MLEQAVIEILSGDTALVAFVGSRIRPLIGNQSDVQPRIAYLITSDEGIPTFDGTSAFSTAVVEIDIIADTYLSCAQVSAEVKRVLNGVAVNTTTVRICPSNLTDQTDIEEALIEGTEVPVFLRTQNYSVLYRAIS